MFLSACVCNMRMGRARKGSIKVFKAAIPLCSAHVKNPRVLTCSMHSGWCPFYIFSPVLWSPFRGFLVTYWAHGTIIHEVGRKILRRLDLGNCSHTFGCAMPPPFDSAFIRPCLVVTMLRSYFRSCVKHGTTLGRPFQAFRAPIKIL